jgi:Na(+)-translocating NADH:ubiquinone oxidoreductase A subunit
MMHSSGELVASRVSAGDRVKTGSVIAESETEPNLIVLSPITGKVAEVLPTKGKRRKLRPGYIEIERTGDDEFERMSDYSAELEQFSPQLGRSMLVRAGMWPLVGQYPSNGKFAEIDRDPNAAVVKAVKAEPFMPRGHILLADRLGEFVRGLGFLQRIVGGQAKIHLVITAEESALAREIKERTRGKAWLALHYLPVAYPVENDGFLHQVLFSGRDKKKDFHAWYFDVETVMQVGRCLGEGIAPYDRVIALGGNGFKDPVHVRARLGASANEIAGIRLVETETRLVRGGLLTGRTVGADTETIDILDQSICAVAEGRERVLLGFLRPGREVDSYSKSFLSMFSPDSPKDCSTNLRGEPRQCVCCGYCEEICPVNIMPHQLYKYASKDLIDELESTGIHLCIECGLCSYVCPSKIEIRSFLIEAKQKLAAEKMESKK